MTSFARSSSGRRAFHVVRASGASTWRIRSEASPTYVAESPTQAQAVYVASRMAQASAPSRLVVHGNDGRIEAERVYNRESQSQHLAG
jgi:hypothetical protein